jgi:predicted DCC family thiol-disulfide oxidoreductase YuxK
MRGFMVADNKCIILFDGVCNFCNGIVKFTINKDLKSKLKYASLQSENGQKLLNHFNLPTEDFDSFVFISGEQYFIKSSAVLQVLKELGGVWKMLYFFLIIFPTPFRDFFYDKIAKSRYRIFGKRETCIVPTADVKKRFL